MKKVIYSLCLLFALTAMSVDASAQQAKSARNDQFGLINHWAIGVDLISPDGFGINVGTCITPWLQVRAGYAIVPWSITKWPATIDGVGVKGQPISFDVMLGSNKVHMAAGAFMMRHTGNIMADFFPSRKSSFHFTVGMLVGNDNIITLRNTAPLTQFEGVGFEFYPGGKKDGDDAIKNRHRVLVTNGNIELTIGRTWIARPYVGLGWGSFVPSKRVGVLFDMGIEYNGGMGIIVNALDATDKASRGKLDGAAVQTLIQSITGKENVDPQISNIYQTVSSIPVAGYIKLALVFKLF
ncbi:MAG: hypothetical protein K5651_02030 [Bacteroidales bacterium]|nr:hypothetical protein [Bacteroidales bacterium]